MAHLMSEDTKAPYEYAQDQAPPIHESGDIWENNDGLRRRLGNRQIQLIAIGGSIGTALFISIGTGLASGGPGSLFIAYTICTLLLGLVNNCMAERTVLMPVSGGFVRLAGKWVDDAFGFMAGWNFFLYGALLIPIEITALTSVLAFWSPDIPPWSGKVILIALLFCFTFFTMVGCNPQHDAYGFRNWSHPGSFAEHITTGPLGRFEGFLAALWAASFPIVGPEYASMTAGEAKRPRVTVKDAFKTMYWRFGVFFIIGALACRIILPYDDPTLVDILSGKATGSGTANASPYVIAMKNLGISVLPQVVSVLMVTSIFSAGNTLTYCATRSLYGLALEGRAPRLLRKCTKSGIPIYCFAVVMVFPFLSFLQVSNSSVVVLNWLVNLITAGGIINSQGIDRRTFPYTAYFQPYSAYIGLAWMICIVTCYGYTSFAPWSVTSFFTYYTMVIDAPVRFFFWKFFKGTRLVKSVEADLIWERPMNDAYEATFAEPAIGFWRECGQMIGIGRGKGRGKAEADGEIHTS
ncbi:hypothetical protein LTR78_005314 [Recurvomyces mirabilis]|uniref:Amino acid permease/ SLC12A domain-containing protein n=1 Tax=Recurvomyces mirabilis TaxID=574656 RepID=A0AAE1C1W5_9PEZI|nr:hypothetical protein LTR78_005314 [Recurvomyces mirabilis]KAK5157864.1 hypothetical protein LTS14_003786 [Recurvomyces mirabilis]